MALPPHVFRCDGDRSHGWSGRIEGLMLCYGRTVGISIRHALGAPYANEFTCVVYLSAVVVIQTTV